MRILIFFVFLSFSSNIISIKAEGIFGDILGNALNEMGEQLENAQSNDSSGNFNADGSINLEQVFENSKNTEVQWSPHTWISVGAPKHCPNWYSAYFEERQDAKKRYPTESRWYFDCHQYYPDAKKPFIDYEALCETLGPEDCAVAKQYRKIGKERDKAFLEYSSALVKIAEAIGLKENASDLTATIEYLKSEGIEGTREYDEGIEVAWVETQNLADEILNTLGKGYVPSDTETKLLQQAVKLSNSAVLSWSRATKERDNLKKMNSTGSLLSSFSITVFDDSGFKDLAKRIENQLIEYENTVSLNTGKDLDLDDANLDDELDNFEF